MIKAYVRNVDSAWIVHVGDFPKSPHLMSPAERWRYLRGAYVRHSWEDAVHEGLSQVNAWRCLVDANPHCTEDIRCVQHPMPVDSHGYTEWRRVHA